MSSNWNMTIHNHRTSFEVGKGLHNKPSLSKPRSVQGRIRQRDLLQLCCHNRTSHGHGSMFRRISVECWMGNPGIDLALQD